MIGLTKLVSIKLNDTFADNYLIQSFIMKTIHYFLLTLLSGTLLFGTYACKNGNSSMARLGSLSGFASEALNHIPEDAYSVGRINVNALMDKADFDNMKKMEFYQDAIKEAEERGDITADILRNPKNSGIDLGDHAYFFSQADKNERKEDFAGIVFKLSDANQFEELVKTKEGVNVETEEGYKFAQTGDKAIVAWTDNLAVIGSGERRDLKNDIINVFNTDKGSSIAQNSNLTKFLRENHDLSLWMGSDAYANRLYNSMQRQMVLMGIGKDDLKDNYINAYADFEDGAIVSKADYILKNVLTKDINMVLGNEVKTDFSAYMPAENLGTAMSFRVDFKGLQQLLKEKGFGGLVNMGLSEYGLNTEDFGETFDGDVMIAAYDNGTEKTPSSLAIMSISDTERLDKFIELGEKINMLSKNDDGTYEMRGTSGMLDKMADESKRPRRFSEGTPNATLLIKEDKIFITDRADIIDQLKSGKYARSAQVKGNAADVLSGNIFGMYVDASKMSGMSEDLDGRYIKDMKVTTGNKKSDMIINMLNENQNSLKTLTEMLNEQYKKENINVNWDDDSES